MFICSLHRYIRGKKRVGKSMTSVFGRETMADSVSAARSKRKSAGL